MLGGIPNIIFFGGVPQHKISYLWNYLDIVGDRQVIIRFNKQEPIQAELKDNQYIITFPIDKSAKPGTRYRGPDYAVKVWLDAETGKVLKVLGGS